MGVSERDQGGRLGKYDLIAELPREDGAEPYLAAAVAPGGYAKLAVIRRLRPSGGGAEESSLDRETVLEDLRLRARLKHANIVETYEILSEGGETFVATEYVEGQSLARVIDKIGANALGRGKWIRILIEVLAGLHYAHEALDEGGRSLQVTHLGLSAARVFITYDGQVKIDFYPRAEDLASDRAASLAPEQARGDVADRRADVFAVGALLWQACTGAPLWGDRDGAWALAELANGRIPSLPEGARVPTLLATIVAHALAPRAADRYSTAMYLQGDLEGFLRASGEVVTPRDVGRVVAHAFIEERLRATTIIDEQLRRVRARAITTRERGERGDGAPSSSDSGAGPVSLLRLETTPRDAGARESRGLVSTARPLAPRTPTSPLTAAIGRAEKAARGRWLVAVVVVFALVAVAAAVRMIGRAR